MEGKGAFYVDLVPAAANVAGGMAAVANPEEADVIITRFCIVTTEAATGATTIDAGVAANATTADDTLLDGRTVHEVGLRDNIEDQDTNGRRARLWGADEFITVTKVAGAASSEDGLVARMYVEYIRV